MGIHGIYKEIGPGQRIALSKVAVEHFEKTGQPLRIAIDISIWLFQIQSGKGGTNPALRTFYYRLLRLISLSIHPLFVFDGPNKPPFKRNKRTGPNVASIPEFLAKQLLKQFGLPFHLAPGEAEAECALLQREGIVDAVLSEDVDTLMFGSGLTFRNWSPEASKSKTPTHINLYDAKKTKETSGLDRAGMILVALMSGGDYVPEGIPGCGPKTACEAARAGFGDSLCKISRKDRGGLRRWKDLLEHELHTNNSKYFNRKHGKLSIPEDFPSSEILGYYTHPVISSTEKLNRLRQNLKWDQEIDFAELRTFTGDAFDWTKLGGAKKFIRNLAPALLVRELRMRGQILISPPVTRGSDASIQGSELIKGVHGSRNHASTDGVTELRVSYTPHLLVPIDLDAEEPDDEIDVDSSDEDIPAASQEVPGSPSKKRTPSTYDPTQEEKLWISETYATAGAPSAIQAWKDRSKNARILVEAKNANREAKRSEREKKQKKASGNAQKGSLDKFTRVTKPGLAKSSSLQAPETSTAETSTVKSCKAAQGIPVLDLSDATSATWLLQQSSAPSSSIQPSSAAVGTHHLAGHRSLDSVRPSVPRECINSQPQIVDLLSSPAPSIHDNSRPECLENIDIPHLLPSTVTKRRRSPLRRIRTDTAVLDMTRDGPGTCSTQVLAFPSSLPSPSQDLPAMKKARAPGQAANDNCSSHHPSTPSKQRRTRSKASVEPVHVISSSPVRQTNIYDYFTPRRRLAAERQRERDLNAISDVQDCPEVQESSEQTIQNIDLTGSPTPKASMRRTQREGLERGSSATNPSIDSMMEVSLSPRPSVRVNKAAITAKTNSANLRKIYRIRDSLPGMFAIEQVDMTEDVNTRHLGISDSSRDTFKKNKKTFRLSEVSILDMTE